MGALAIPLMVVIFVYVVSPIKILNEHERAIILRLGRLVIHPRGPGLILVYRPIDQMFRVKAAELAKGLPIKLMDGLNVRLNGNRLETI